MKKVLLYSGGMDSWLINKLWKPDKLIYVNMHTEYSELEISRLPECVEIIDFPLGQFSLPNSIIPLRNLYLYMVACNVTEFEDVEVCLGALNGDRINDKSIKFVELLNPLLQYLYEEQQSQPGKNIKVSMPFKDSSKRELLELYVKQGGTLREVYESSFSCYHPSVEDKECLSCKACFRKAIPFIVAGMDFTEQEKEKIKQFVKENVLCDMDNYTKDKGKEGEDCLTALQIIDKW